MGEFARGARVKRPKPVDQQLTMLEASFVMCSVAEQHGLKDAEEFLKYMRRAWEAYVASQSPPPQSGEQK